MKYKITIYQETYSEYEIEADSQSNAEDIAFSGLVDPVDVTVKESAVVKSELI